MAHTRPLPAGRRRSGGGPAAGHTRIEISPEIIALVVLPPLLYASAEDMPWWELRAV
ncbi:hypothetical protein ABZX38_32890 [Streptomyces longwoodensis]